MGVWVRLPSSARVRGIVMNRETFIRSLFHLAEERPGAVNVVSMLNARMPYKVDFSYKNWMKNSSGHTVELLQWVDNNGQLLMPWYSGPRLSIEGGSTYHLFTSANGESRADFAGNKVVASDSFTLAAYDASMKQLKVYWIS